MTVELGDERAFRRAMREAVGQAGQEQIQAAAEDALAYAIENLENAEQNPPEGASMDEWHLQGIIDSAELYWESGASEGKLAQGDALVVEFTHPHAGKIEVGVRPHEIEGDPYLAWHDRETGELIVRTKVDHPGYPGVGYLRGAWRRAIAEHFK